MTEDLNKREETMATMNDIIAQIKTLTSINEVEQIMNEESEREYPRKGILVQALIRIGELHLDGQCLSDSNEDNGEEEEGVEQENYTTDEDHLDLVKRFLTYIDFQNPVGDEFMRHINLSPWRERETTGMNLWITLREYQQHRGAYHSLVGDIQKAAQAAGHWTRIIKDPGSQAYLKIVWKRKQ